MKLYVVVLFLLISVSVVTSNKSLLCSFCHLFVHSLTHSHSKGNNNFEDFFQGLPRDLNAGPVTTIVPPVLTNFSEGLKINPDLICSTFCISNIENDKSDFGCSMCTGLVTKVKNSVGSQASPEIIKNNFGRSCQKFSIAKWCDKEILPHVDKLVEGILLNQRPTVLCSKITKTCPTQQLQNMKDSFFGIPRDDCSMCQNTLQRVELIVSFYGNIYDKNKESSDLSEELLNSLICADPSFKEKCERIIVSNLNSIITEIMLESSSSQSCENLGFCSATQKLQSSHNSKQASPNSAHSCFACKSVGYASLMVPRSDESQYNSLANVCATISQLGNLDKEFCDILSKKWSEALPESTDTTDDIPARKCELWKYCTPQFEHDKKISTRPRDAKNQASSQTSKRSTSQQASSSQPASPDSNIAPNSFSQLLWTLPSKTSTPIDDAFGDDISCEMCQWAASAVEAYLSQDTTQTELSRVLQDLCTALPPEYSKLCSSFVSAYLTELLVYLLDRVTPPVICNRLLQCS